MNKLSVEIEQSATGPLAHQTTMAKLLDAVRESNCLDEANIRIGTINGLAVYRGGSHVAVHRMFRGKFVHGTDGRVAIVTEGP